MVPSNEWRVRPAVGCRTTETLSTLKALKTAGRSADSARSVVQWFKRGCWDISIAFAYHSSSVCLYLDLVSGRQLALCPTSEQQGSCAVRSLELLESADKA